MNTLNKRYDSLIVDTVNLAYKTFNMKSEIPVQISQKSVYKESVCKFIKSIESLKSEFLDYEGQVYLLFDNYFSRADLQSCFLFADRKSLNEAYKANRTKESKSFYSSINLLRYYYLLGDPLYHTARIDGLEADDLVKPLLETDCKDKSALLITNDLDWSRYLSDRIDWLPELNKNPENFRDLSSKLGFKVTETNIITYKAIFGDPSDNIEGIINENSNTKEQFMKLIKMINYPEDLIFLSRDVEKREEYSILRNISNNERRYQVNVQVISSIPCAPEIFRKNLTQGKNSSNMYKVVREALGLDGSNGVFVFGGLKRPRG